MRPKARAGRGAIMDAASEDAGPDMALSVETLAPDERRFLWLLRLWLPGHGGQAEAWQRPFFSIRRVVGLRRNRAGRSTLL